MAHNSLGFALLDKGDLEEAARCFGVALDLFPPNHPERPGAVRMLERCKRLLALEDKLPAFLEGTARPANTSERVALADLCRFRQRYAAAARFYTEAFADQPKLATVHWFNATRAAAGAGTDRGQDAGQLDDKERARLRGQALDWLRANLDLRAKQLDSGKPAGSQQVFAYMQRTPDLAGVRDKDALAKLPEEERKQWQKLWADVEALLAKARSAKKP